MATKIKIRNNKDTIAVVKYTILLVITFEKSEFRYNNPVDNSLPIVAITVVMKIANGWLSSFIKSGTNGRLPVISPGSVKA